MLFSRQLRLCAVIAIAITPLPYLLAAAPSAPRQWEDIDLAGLPEIRSEHGVLTATLTAAPLMVRIGPVSFPGITYNGVYGGPVLRARPGDLVRIKLINHLSEPTNLHFHGLRVSPEGRGDNMHIVVPAGDSFDYQFRIPRQQPPGLFWYHDHMHGSTESHVMGGLGGAFLIDGFLGEFSPSVPIAQKLLILKDATLPGCQGAALKAALHCRVISVNGVPDWRVSMHPAETQLWRICNQGANLWVHLALPGAQLHIIGRDGTPAAILTRTDTIDVMPSARMDVLVTAGAPGTLVLSAVNVPTGLGNAMVMRRPLGAVRVAGAPPALAAPTLSFPRQVDLRDGQGATHRAIVFSEDADAARYFINGRLFEHDRIDIRVPFGSVEEWTVRNRSEDFHEFHIHQLGFQVIEINGVKQPFDGYLDDVQVPEMGEVKLLVPFTDPVLIGRFMFHCHVLKHEDDGMMANVEVFRPSANAAPHLCRYADTAEDAK